MNSQRERSIDELADAGVDGLRHLDLAAVLRQAGRLLAAGQPSRDGVTAR